MILNQVNVPFGKRNSYFGLKMCFPLSEKIDFYCSLPGCIECGAMQGLSKINWFQRFHYLVKAVFYVLTEDSLIHTVACIVLWSHWWPDTWGGFSSMTWLPAWRSDNHRPPIKLKLCNQNESWSKWSSVFMIWASSSYESKEFWMASVIKLELRENLTNSPYNFNLFTDTYLVPNLILWFLQ